MGSSKQLPSNSGELLDSPEGTRQNAEAKSKSQQFGIAALFWATFIAGISLSYLRRLEGADVMIGGLLAVSVGVVVGLIVGLITRRIGDAMFWGTLIAAFGYMSMARDPVVDMNQRMAWAVLGAFTGAIGATVLTEKPFANALVCGAVAGAVMFVCWSIVKQMPGWRREWDFDLIAAPVIGVAIAIFLRVLSWIESKQKMPRYLTATWLMVVVIIGNLLA